MKFCLTIDARKEKEDSWLNAIQSKNKKNCVRKSRARLNFIDKSTTAANVHLMESLLDNWLNNNHVTVDIHGICYWPAGRSV